MTNIAAELRAMGTSNTVPDMEQMNALLIVAAEEIDQLRAALKKFGRHPTGDMEGVGRCAGFRLAAPFRDELCNCGLNAALIGPQRP